MADIKKFIGRYALVKSDNFDAYMKALSKYCCLFIWVGGAQVEYA